MFTLRRAIHFKNSTRSKSTLVLIEHKDGAIASSSLNAVAAGVQLGFPVSALVAGAGAHAGAAAAAAARIGGVARVFAADSAAHAHAAPETLAPLVRSLVAAHGVTHVVAAASAFGKNAVPRIAALLDVSPVADVVAIKDAATFVRPIYAGNAIATVQSADPVKLLTVRATAFAPAARDGGAAEVVPVDAALSAAPVRVSEWVGEEIVKSDRPELGNAKIVVAGGRGLKNGENFKLLYDLADKVGGAVGASRAAVDAGFVSNDLQIGQTGKIVAPQLYFAVGISGAIQHLAGMKDSKVIVSINKDAEAPIFQVSDFGLVGDLFKVLPELTEKLK
ncbi:DHS-like NAD/FAD-binding domain-containing protein [Obelidium mucronatum]|nr:DHS-like NAD/FAD-binding domain-containing protein [Obelidium mucronatum]